MDGKKSHLVSNPSSMSISQGQRKQEENRPPFGEMRSVSDLGPLLRTNAESLGSLGSLTISSEASVNPKPSVLVSQKPSEVQGSDRFGMGILYTPTSSKAGSTTSLFGEQEEQFVEDEHPWKYGSSKFDPHPYSRSSSRRNSYE